MIYSFSKFLYKHVLQAFWLTAIAQSNHQNQICPYQLLTKMTLLILISLIPWARLTCFPTSNSEMAARVAKCAIVMTGFHDSSEIKRESPHSGVASASHAEE